jgi:hypothetical protein
MTFRKLCSTVATAALLTAVAFTPAVAAKKNKCPKECRAEIAACRNAVPKPNTCNELSGKEKKTCKRDITKRKKNCRTDFIRLCKQRSGTVPDDACSPSGAFLD